MASREAKEIEKALTTLYEYCVNVQDHDRCDECPISFVCFDDPSISIAEMFDISLYRLDEFIDYSDRVTFRDEDLKAQYADQQRKSDIEERMIDGY